MNIAKMMQQANKMQNDMKVMQEKLANTIVEETLSGINVKITGDGEVLKGLTIDAALIDPSDKETLEDLLVAAVNKAIGKSKQLGAEEGKKIMGGLQLPPGMKLPF